MNSTLRQIEKSAPGLVAVFDFDAIRDLLHHLFQAKKKANPRFSARAWARQLGYKNSSFLVDVLHGRRRISNELAEKIAIHLNLSGRERSYFDGLVVLSRDLSVAQADTIKKQLDRLRPDTERTTLSQSYFKLISHWYYLTVLEMFDLKDFKLDSAFIARRLASKVPPSDVDAAIEQLLRLELLHKGEDSIVRRTEGNPALKDEVPSEAVRNHHREMLFLARQALRKQNLHERDFRATKVAIKKSDLSAAKEIVKQCHQQLQKLAAKEGEADDVYALNTQMFRLTGEVRS